MSDRSNLVSRLIVVGANHRSSALSIREKLVVEETGLPSLLKRLREGGLENAVVLSTGDQIEVLTLHESSDTVVETISAALVDHAGLEPGDLSGQLFVFSAEEAMRHVFALTASLDSIIPGDPRFFGKVKACYGHAREAGMTNPELESLLEAAFAASKRVHSETSIAERPGSVAAAAVQIAQNIHGDLSQCSGLLMGAGDVAELLAGYLRDAGMKGLVFTGDSATQLEHVAQRIESRIVPLDDLAEAIAEADVLVASLGTQGRLISVELAETALKKRRRKPILMIDAAIPGNIERLVGELDGAFLYDINDLEQLVIEGWAESEAAAATAWNIIEAELTSFLRKDAPARAAPLLETLNRHFATVLDEVLGELGDSGIDEKVRLSADHLIRETSGELQKICGKASNSTLQQWEERFLFRLFRLPGEFDGTSSGDERE